MLRWPTVAAPGLVLALAAVVPVLAADRAPPAAADETVLERFPIDRQGYYLLLPLDVGGKRYTFVLDTGATCTVYDASLRPLLGEPLRLERMSTPNGVVTIPVFRSPPARLGKLTLPAGSSVLVADLAKLRQAADTEIYGLLGMDFLSNHVLRIDFDRGEVVFLRSAGTDAGQRVPIALRQLCPHVLVRLAGADGPEEFLMDTGMGGDDSGDVEASLFDALVRKGAVTSLVRLRSADLSGDSDQRQGRVASMEFAGHTHARPLFSTATNNALSLRFWSRYVVTCDFPRGALYLKKGRLFDQPDRQNRSGLHVLRVNGETTVERVDEGSPARAAGVRPRDVLVRLDGAAVRGLSLIDLRRRLCAEGRRVSLVVRRGEQEHEYSFDLPPAE